MQVVYKESNKGVICSDVLSHVFDVKMWLTPHLEDLHQHTQPHVFKFSQNSSGKAELYYKKWSHMDWMGPLSVLKVITYSNLFFLTVSEVK